MNNNNNNNQQYKDKVQNELGALWKKKSKNGLSFLSGYITDHDGSRTDIVVFANSKKSNDKAPDYRLYLSKPLAGKPNETKTTVPVKKVNEQKVVKQVEEDEDDIL